MTELKHPTLKDEAWRYADFAALATLAPERFGEWKEIELAPGERRRKCLVLDGSGPELHRVCLTVGEAARAELFAVNAGADYTRLEVEVRLARGAHFEFGGVTIGGGEATREFVTRLDHAEPEATSNQVVRAVHWGQATSIRPRRRRSCSSARSSATPSSRWMTRQSRTRCSKRRWRRSETRYEFPNLSVRVERSRDT